MIGCHPMRRLVWSVPLAAMALCWMAWKAAADASNPLATPKYTDPSGATLALYYYNGIYTLGTNSTAKPWSITMSPGSSLAVLWVYNNQTEALQVKNTSMCLTDYDEYSAGAYSAPGPVLIGCANPRLMTAGQKWYMVSNNTGYGFLRSRSGRCLSTTQEMSANGTHTVLWVNCAMAANLTAPVYPGRELKFIV